MDRFVPRDDGHYPSLRLNRPCQSLVIASAAQQSLPRHCERSVAIHVFVQRLSWIASFLAMTAITRHCD
jgi:hypothetical protein